MVMSHDIQYKNTDEIRMFIYNIMLSSNKDNAELHKWYNSNTITHTIIVKLCHMYIMENFSNEINNYGLYDDVLKNFLKIKNNEELKFEILQTFVSKFMEKQTPISSFQNLATNNVVVQKTCPFMKLMVIFSIVLVIISYFMITAK